jgi:hypothetical protein
MFLCVPVCPLETTEFVLDRSSSNLIYRPVSKIPKEISSSITFLARLKCTLYLLQRLTEFFLQEEMFHKVLMKSKTHT